MLAMGTHADLSTLVNFTYVHRRDGRRPVGDDGQHMGEWAGGDEVTMVQR